MTILFIILGLYILNVVINRYISIAIQKKLSDMVEFLTFVCFLSLFGTFALLFILFLESETKITKIPKWFKYTPILLLFLLESCTWKHDNIFVKDRYGNIYQLKSSGVRNESYDLKEVDTNEIKLK